MTKPEAAGAQTIGDHIAEAHGAQEQADDVVQRAEARLAMREATRERLATDLEKVTVELGSLEMRDEVEQEHVVEEANLRRAERRLEAELAAAHTEVAKARAELEDAQRASAVARLAVLDGEIKVVDAEYVTAAKAFSDQLAQMRAAIRAKVDKANEIDQSLMAAEARFSFTATHRGALAALRDHGVDELTFAAETLQRLDTIRREINAAVPGRFGEAYQHLQSN